MATSHVEIVSMLDEDQDEKPLRESKTVPKRKAPVNLKSVKLPVVETIGLQDLPAHTIPADLSQNRYTSFIVPLTKAGVEAATQLAGKTKNTLCLICLDIGKSVKDSLHAAIIGKSGGNLNRHFRAHIDDGNVTPEGNRTMERIEELRGKVLGPAGHLVLEKNEEGVLQCAKTSTSKSDLEAAIFDLILEQGLSFEVVNSPKFRRVLTIAKRLKGTKATKISSKRLKKLILEKFRKFLRSLAADFKYFSSPRVHIVHDGWEHHGVKYIGVSAAYIKTGQSGNATFEIVPLALKRLETDYATSTIQSEEGMTKAINKVVSDLKLDKKGVASLKSDNAANGVSCGFFGFNTSFDFTNLGYKFFAGLSSDLFDDHQPKVLQGCISHSIALAGAYGLGIKKFSNESSAMPPPPPLVENAIAAARAQCVFLRVPKIASSARQLASKKGSSVKFVAPSLDNATRWWSMTKMFRCVILNRDLVERLGQNQGQLTDQEYLLIQEVYAIIRPLTDVALALTQISRKPIGPATLPLIAFIFSRYGVLMDRGLYGEVSVSPRAGEEVAFDVLKHDGTSEVRLLHSFSSIGKEFYRCWVSHLIGRLKTERGNRFFYEVIGLLLDPVMKNFQGMVFASAAFPLSESWNISEARWWCYRAMEKAREVSRAALASAPAKAKQPVEASTASTHKKVRLSGATINTGQPSVEQEYAAFQSEMHPIFSNFVDADNELAVNFDDFCVILKEYDPLCYWNGAGGGLQRPSSRFPTVFEVNLATLPYLASSAFQERVFSCAEHVLNERRSRLGQRLAEACVLMNARASNEKSRAKSKAEEKESPSGDEIESCDGNEENDSMLNEDELSEEEA